MKLVLGIHGSLSNEDVYRRKVKIYVALESTDCAQFVVQFKLEQEGDRMGCTRAISDPGRIDFRSEEIGVE